MRKIKFRGFYPYWELYDDMKSGWIYGYLGKDIDSGEYFIQSIDEGQGYGEGFGVLKETIGQYTGRNDKEGTEIYEGDITIATINKRLAVIRFGEYKDVFGDRQFGFYYQGKEWDYSFMADNSNVLVIGNIHDNPELLEVKK